jgi:hypothetical protein
MAKNKRKVKINVDKYKLIQSKLKTINKLIKENAQKPKNTRQNYTQEELDKAIGDIKNKGLSQREVARLYDIPLTTIHNTLKGNYSSNKIGKQPLLTEEIEKIFVQTLIRLADIGIGLNKLEIFSVMKMYLTRTNQENLFKDGTPSNKWYDGFLGRYPEISVRIAQNFALNRAKGITLESAEEWYQSVASLYNECWPDGNVPSTHLWNCDESGYSGHQGSLLIVCKKGSKNPVRIVGDNEKAFYTVNSCGSAAGDYMPHFILYKAKTELHLEWTEDGPPNAGYATSPSGWMEGPQFLEWFKMFVNHVRVERKLIGPIILFFDGHASHTSLEIIDLAIEQNIRLKCLMPHSSHGHQPMDVGVYHQAKVCMRKIVAQFYTTTRWSKITKSHFARLFGLLVKVAFLPEHIVAGFRKSGLYPLSREMITEHSKVKNSTLFTSTPAQNPSSTSTLFTSTPAPNPSSTSTLFTSTPAPNPSSTSNLFGSPIIPTPISRRSIFVDITNQANAKEDRITSLAHCLGDSIIDFFKRDQTPKPSKKTVVWKREHA